MFKWKKQKSKIETHTKLENDHYTGVKQNHKVSPLGQTGNDWEMNKNREDKVFEPGQIHVYKDPTKIDKGSLAYTEAWSNRIRCTKRQVHSKGVRISGRRFTTGCYKAKLGIQQSWYESEEVYRNKTSNAQKLTKLADIKPTECLANTPEKYSYQSSLKNNKTDSSYSK